MAGSPQSAPGRAILYVLLAALLLTGFLLVRSAEWNGSVSSHTIMEVIATVLATVVGIVALLRFYTSRGGLFLFLGTGFLGTALLDGYHTLVTSAWFQSRYPSSTTQLSPWSQTASRTFLSLMVFLGGWAASRESAQGRRQRLPERTIIGISALMVLCTFILFALIPLPATHTPGFFLANPAEALPALFFGAALVGFLRRGTWRTDALEHWIVLSLIVGFMGQIFFMSSASHLFDAMFDMAHLLKKLSYMLVLTGLCVGMYALFREAEEGARNLRTLIDANPSATVAVDRSGNIRLFNAAAEKLFGYRRDEVEGGTLERLVPTSLRDRHREHRETFQKNPSARRMAVEQNLAALHKDGSEIPVAISLAPVRLSGEQIVLGGILDLREIRKVEAELRGLNETLESRIRHRTRDLEESRAAAMTLLEEAQEARKRAEEAEEGLRLHAEELARSNADLENFAYVASHDLKSPLRAIDNLSTWLAEDLEELLNDETREQMNLLRGRVHRMEMMIDGLLQYSRAGRKDYDVEEVPVSELVDEIRETLHVPGRMSVCTEGTLPTLHTQRPPLQQVLLNLINNAIKHHDRPDGTVEVRCRENGRFYEFAVRDDGPGIPEQYHQKIFQMFQTLKSRDTLESTGLGLALVKRIVERVGGRVSVESGEGRGAEFRFQWPKNGNGRREA